MLLGQYESWSQEVSRGYKKVTHFYALPHSLETMHGARGVIKRPKWVDQCLKDQPRSLVYVEPQKKYSWNKVRKNSVIGTDLLNSCADTVLEYANAYKDYIYERFGITEEIIYETIPTKTSIFKPWKWQGYSIWAEAYIYLDIYIKSYERVLTESSRSALDIKYYSGIDSRGFFNCWLIGPVKAAQRYQCTNTENAGSLLYMLSKYWVWNHLYAQYCRYLSVIISQDMTCRWDYRHASLERLLLWEEDTNKYLFHKKKGIAYFEVFSQHKSIDNLLEIYREGFVTTDEFEKSAIIRKQIARLSMSIGMDTDSVNKVNKALELRKRI